MAKKKSGLGDNMGILGGLGGDALSFLVSGSTLTNEDKKENDNKTPRKEVKKDKTPSKAKKELKNAKPIKGRAPIEKKLKSPTTQNKNKSFITFSISENLFDKLDNYCFSNESSSLKIATNTYSFFASVLYGENYDKYIDFMTTNQKYDDLNKGSMKITISADLKMIKDFEKLQKKLRIRNKSCLYRSIIEFFIS